MATTEQRASQAAIVEAPASPPDSFAPVIGTDHPLYPVLIGLALFPIAMGTPGHHVAEDMDIEDTHPFFPDHFWPYPIIMALMVATVAYLSWGFPHALALQPPANPRVPWFPRPDWYFLFLFQFLKLGNEVIMEVVIPTVWIVILLLWPFIDQSIGPPAARLLRLPKWEIPGHNLITGGLGWMVIAGLVLLTMWSLSGVSLFGVYNG